MLVNENRAIRTDKILLVPYEKRHVPQYHQWMQDPAIQEATASEPLTLEEEYENQTSWRTSHDKLTFILCAAAGHTPVAIEAGQEDTEVLMRGDINFFIYPYEFDEGEKENPNWVIGEIDIMIAATDHRRQGLGRSAVQALVVYIRKNLSNILKEYGTAENSQPELRGLMVKLKEGNKGSRALFERLGFQQQGEVNYFGEVKLVMSWEKLLGEAWLSEAASDYQELDYHQC